MVNFFFVIFSILFFCDCKASHYPKIITGSITEETQWMKISLTNIMSKTIHIDFSIKFPSNLCCPYLVTSMYEHTINDQNKCIADFYGQVTNKKMVVPLTCQSFAGFTACTKSNSSFSCNVGTLQVQDWKPRLFWAGFGFACQGMYHKGCDNWALDYCRNIGRCKTSLQGLSYEIRIRNQFNDTTCLAVADDIHEKCQLNYTHGLAPTMVGNQGFDGIESMIRMGYSLFNHSKVCKDCYQHVILSLCRIWFVECTSDNLHGMLPLCREMCEEGFSACTDCVMYQLGGDFNCSHLPSRFSSTDIPCFNQPVDCGIPQNTTDSHVLTYNSTNAHGQATYRCYDLSLTLENGGISRCMLSGKWSPIEHCTKSPVQKLIVAITVALMFALLLLLAIVYCHYFRRPHPTPFNRQKAYDSVVFYPYEESHKEFVRLLQNELEIKCQPPLKLIIHGRDFKPGVDIKHNIREAVQNSNSAIILMSQYFVNSFWCRDEFEECYIENKKDPGFEIFVIMMEPRDRLYKLTAYMQSFFDTKTYLERNDEHLFAKLAESIHAIRNPSNGKDNRQIHDAEGDDHEEETGV